MKWGTKYYKIELIEKGQVGDTVRRAGIGVAQGNVVRIRICERGSLAGNFDCRLLGGDG